MNADRAPKASLSSSRGEGLLPRTPVMPGAHSPKPRPSFVGWLRSQIAAFSTYLDDVEAIINRDTELDA